MSWNKILGHESNVRAFEIAWKKNRLAHAYLFVGPSGIGKRMFATELGKALFCVNVKEKLEACDHCPNCVQLQSGNHPDFTIFSRPEEVVEFPIDVIRQISESLAFKPMRGTRRIAVLDNADELNQTAANAFLKTLEEPPVGSILILIGGASVEQQLPTILSRCQLIRFSPLKPELLRSWLESREGIDPKKIDRLVRLSGGAPGQAVELDDDELWNFRQRILQTFADPNRNSVETAKEWMKALEAFSSQGPMQRRRAGLLLRLLMEVLELALRKSLNVELPLDASELKWISAIADRNGPDRLLKWLDRALEAERQLDRMVQLVLVIEGLHDALREPIPLAPNRR